MRKFLIFATAAAVMLMLFSASADARRPRRKYIPPQDWSVRLNVGMPSYSTSYFANGQMGHDFFYSSNGTLKDAFEDKCGPTYTTGPIGASFTYNVSRWFVLVADVGATFCWNKRYSFDGEEYTGTKVGAAIYAMPGIRFNYVTRPVWRLYSSLQVGLCSYAGFDRLEANGYSLIELCPQVGLLGLEVGPKNSRWFGWAECGIGLISFGYRGGIGYRF